VILSAFALPTARAAPVGKAAFIEDDYPRALAEARRRHLPIFVDTWAPWCHTCLYMRAYVFGEGPPARFADRFVWLSIDVEKEVNQAFVTRYPSGVVPTLMVIDPGREALALTWPGSADRPRLEHLLQEGERAWKAHGVPAAEASYRRLITETTGLPRARAVEGLALYYQERREYERCAQIAMAEAATLTRGSSFTNAVVAGLDCATAARATEPWRMPALKALIPLGKEAVAVPALMADDRSGAFEAVVDALTDAGESAEARAAASRWLEFLEAEAERAGSAEARAAFDAHRVLAAKAAGTPERAITPLLAREKELPYDYNAPARLALVYASLRRYPEADQAMTRALKLVYGPRRVRLLENQADLKEAAGDAAGARRSLAAAIALLDALPKTPSRVEAAARLRTRLGRLP
jgi:hypothetical protein